MQPRSLEPAPTSQSIASRRSSPRAAQPTSTIGRSRFASRRDTRCSRRCTHPRCGSADVAAAWAPRDNTRAGGVWLGPIRRTHPSIHPAPNRRAIFVLLEEGTPRARRAPTHPSSEAIESLPRFEKIKNGLSVEPCHAREARLPQLVAGYFRRRRVLACPGAGRGCIAAHRAPSSVIHPHALAPNVARTTHERLLTAVLSIGAAAGELSHPKLLPRRSCGPGLSDRSDGCRRLSSLVWDSTTPTDHCLLSTFCPSHLHRAGHRRPPASSPACCTFRYPSHLIPPRAAAPGLCHDALSRRRGVEEVRLRCGGAGEQAARSGGHCRLISTRMGCSPVRRIRPSRISTARRGVRGGAFALQLGDVHTAARVFGAPQAVYRACGT
ncbi:hypothetical protein B0H14DRAFT_352483 [Mycena olivaceomarginata]|nr:hypothetical protein B0H14DRAFT_352483 [Mycena olivaceomarginata]